MTDEQRTLSESANSLDRSTDGYDKLLVKQLRALLSASKPAAMSGKDAVTREQIKAWAKLAGIPTMFEKHIEQLGDFAIFARMDYAAAPAAPAQSDSK
jgi:hypothetical protein